MTARLLPWLLLAWLLSTVGAAAWAYTRGESAEGARRDASTAIAWEAALRSALQRERALHAQVAELDARGAREEAEVRVETRTIVRTVTEIVEREPTEPDHCLPADALRVLNDARAASAD